VAWKLTPHCGPGRVSHHLPHHRRQQRISWSGVNRRPRDRVVKVGRRASEEWDRSLVCSAEVVIEQMPIMNHLNWNEVLG